MSRKSECAFSMDDLGELFPFHLVLDPQLAIIQIGPALARVCGDIQHGAKVSAHFRLLRPALSWSERTVARKGALFIVEHHGTRLILKGEMRHLPQRVAASISTSPSR